MSLPILDEIRDRCSWVARRSRFVAIDEARLPAYAAALGGEGLPEPVYDTARHFRGAEDATAAFVLTLDSVNFGSGYFPLLRKRPGLSGYFTIAASLTERFERDGPFAAAELAAITPEECASLFGQADSSEPVRELMAAFASALNDLGRLVDGRYAGRFLGLVDAADRSAERLVALLAEMPAFRDVAPYDGTAVPFYKRAQLAAADLHLAFDGHGPGRFDDLDRLTIFADNLVPHVLRVDGLLRYSPDLAARIDREEPIPSGSPEEVEIRACAVAAAERLVEHLNAAGPAATGQRLDALLWNRGQRPEYKARPRHRTRSRFY